jgi:hypothetical protein
MKLPDNLTEQQLSNLLATLEYADKEAEAYGDRRDTLKVQQQVQEIRERIKMLNERPKQHEH